MRPGQDHARAVQHGTLAYMPPELILEDAISFATDVYSFGILLWEMFSMKVSVQSLRRKSIAHCKCMKVVLLYYSAQGLVHALMPQPRLILVNSCQVCRQRSNDCVSHGQHCSEN